MPFDFQNNPVSGSIQAGPNGTVWEFDGVKWIGTGGGPFLSLSGGQMQGELQLANDPTHANDAVTKNYVDYVLNNNIPEALMDGQAYGRELRTWTPVLPITGGFMRGDLSVNGFKLTGLPMPLLPADAVPKSYVDQSVTGHQIFMGTWQVAANTPDLSVTTGNVNGAYWTALTANPTIPENAPASIPGIGGQVIHNGDTIIWVSASHVYQIIPGGQLSKPQADALYVAIAGSTMTGTLVLAHDPVNPLEAVTKQYADTHGGGSTGVVTDNSSIIGAGTSAQPLMANIIDGGTY